MTGEREQKMAMAGLGTKSLTGVAVILGIMSALSSAAVCQQPLENNDSVLFDGVALTLTLGKAKSDVAGQIRALGARDLGPGAIIFRSGEKLYIVDAPLRLSNTQPDGGRRMYIAADSSQPNRIRVEYTLPKNPEHQQTYDMLKEQKALETLQKIFSPFRLPEELTIRTLSCDGLVNAWYDRENARPTVSICYEYLDHILRSLPKETTPAGITATDAKIGQFFWIVSHEVGHAIFDIFNIPVFGREEDAADQFAVYVMLQFGSDRARRLISGAAWTFKEYVQDYRKNPEVAMKLAAFASNHGQPEERFYDLMCMAYGADPVLFAFVTQDGWLPPSRAPSCKYEYRTLLKAWRLEIAPRLDQQMARQILDARWLPTP
jgi:hypothetical protein